MSAKLPVDNFCRDNRVVTVLFFKKDGSRVVVNCRNEERRCDDDTIVFDDVILVARLMLGGSIDFPYVSSSVVSRQSTTLIEVTTREGEVQRATVRNTIQVIPIRTGGYEVLTENARKASQEESGQQDVAFSGFGVVPLFECDDVEIGGHQWKMEGPNVICVRCRVVHEGTELCERECWQWRIG